MRRLDVTPIDPEVAAALDAIDATLAGEPVDRRHAELAELALLLSGERPEIEGAFATVLDKRLERRFAAPAAPAQESRPRRRPWLTPAAGLATAAVAAVVAIVAISSATDHSLGLPKSAPPAASRSVASTPSARSVAASSQPGGASSQSQAGLPNNARGSITSGSTHSPASSQSAVFQSTSAAAAGPAPTAVLEPIPNGRKITQGAQLALTTAPSRVDEVAQEVFTVVGEESGIVKSSSVTQGGPNGYAEFQLSIPSESLPQAMAALSTLRYAHVASRTDTTQDVNDQYLADVRALADARALRTSLLKQLANATTQAQIDSLTAQIHDAEASISSDEATLRVLNQQVDYSQVTLTINAAPVIVTPTTSGSFTIGKAAHDAARVLTFAAGIALIVAAALLPLALLGALGWWVAAALRRRRREQALDVV